MQLNQENYYNEKEFMSASRYKAFKNCEAKAMAMLKGEWDPGFSEALLVGSYVDEVLTGDDPEGFIEKHRPKIYKKNGDPYAYILKADEAIAALARQPLCRQYLTGDHQVIMTGEIEGVPVKIKMDTYKKGEFISDLKYLASLRSPNLFESPIKYWGYHYQAAIYQEIVRQNTGDKLPFYFVIATKETPAKAIVAQITQPNINEALQEIKENIKHYYDVMTGKEEPEACGDCDYCVQTQILDEIIDTDDLWMTARQRKYKKLKENFING